MGVAMNAPHHPICLAVCLLLCATALPTAARQSIPVADSLLHDAPHALGAEEIRASGSVRVSEQLRMIPGMAVWSNDRYTLRLLGTGQQGLLTAEPAIELDGLVLPFAFLDRTMTESLPVSPVSMSSLRYDAGQRSHEGGRMRDGTVRIRTPMMRGFEVRGALAVINETGDPGPAKHLDGRLQNVDRSGPATSLVAGWGNGTWSVEGGLQSDLHHLTDDRIAGRVRLTYAEDVQPVITQFSPYARLRGRSGAWQVDAAGGRSWRKDFLYHESTGWEWPVRWTRSWSAANVAWERGSMKLGLKADGWLMDSRDRPSFIDVPPGLSLGEGQARFVAGRVGRQWTAQVGAGARGLRASQSGLDRSHLMPLGEFSLAWRHDGWHAAWQVSGLRIDDAVPQARPWSMATSVQWGHRGEKGRWEVHFDGESGHFPETGQLSQWAAWELDLGQWMSAAPLPSGIGTPRLLQGQWLVERLIGNWTGWFSLEGRWMDGVLLQDRVIDQPFGVGPLLPVWNWSAGHSGWLFSRTLGVRRLQPERIQWRAQFQFHHISSQGDDALFRAATGFPRNRVWVSAGEERPGGIRWFLRAAWQSAWTWPQYREPARRTLDPALWLDATVGKTLLSGHIEALVSLLNLPDRPLMTHPGGVEEQMAVRLTLLLSSRPRTTR
jgi:hypothetical protein